MRSERRTLTVMIDMYCAAKHPKDGKTRTGLCPECAETLAYAFERLDRCAFGAGKPVCGRCAVHCYRKDMRERIRQVMRFAGPRMIFRHPFSALLHAARMLLNPPKKPF